MIVKHCPRKAELFREWLKKACDPSSSTQRAPPKLFHEPTGVRIRLAALLASYGHKALTEKKEHREMEALAKALYMTSTAVKKVALFYPLEWAAEEALLRHLEDFRSESADKASFPSTSVSGGILNIFTGMQLGIGSDLEYSTYLEQHHDK